MSEVRLPADFLAQFEALRKRLERLELAPTSVVPVYSAATLPPASAVPNTIVRNTSTGTLQWSDGSSWTNT